MVTPLSIQHSAIERIESYVRRCNAGEFHGEHMVRRLVQYYIACELGLIIIRDQRAQHVALRLNEIQCRAHSLALEQAAQGRPIRITILKSRKGGISTWSETLFVFLCAAYPHQRALTIAHEGRATQEIFEIAQRAAENMSLLPARITSEIDWPGTDSHYHAMTAGGTAVGSGGTPSCLHLSEGPKWDKNREETYTSALNSLPFVPETIAIHEFTAKGREHFYELFDHARRDKDHPYSALFIAWYLDDRCTADAPKDFRPDAEEQRLMVEAARNGVELSNDQLQWRRLKIKESCIGDFRQEYPSTPEEAIQGNRGLILPGIRNLLIAESDLPFDPRSIPMNCRIGGIDHGYHDPTVIWSAFMHDQIFYAVGFYHRTEGLAEEHLTGLMAGHTYFCDPSGTSARLELQKLSERTNMRCKLLPCPATAPTGKDVTHWQIQQMVRIAESGRLRILDTCAEQLILECDNWSWDEKTGKPDDKRGPGWNHYDAIQSLRYMILGVLLSGVSLTHKPREKGHPSRHQQLTRSSL